MIKELFYSHNSHIREVAGVYTCAFLDTDELKMALRARKVSRAFEKRTPGNYAHNCKVFHCFIIYLFSFSD